MQTYEVYAIRYASMPRNRRDNFIYHDDHDGAMPMDFFVWLIKSDEHAILVDTGFNIAAAQARNRNFIGCPIDALTMFGLRASDISDVILTHLHYDHAGNLDKLPAATFHIQESEMEYATGRCMCHPSLRHAYSVDDVTLLVRHVYRDRVKFHQGASTIASNIEVIHVGGHTKGLQAVRVYTQRGWIVLASDAAHYYANRDTGNPFPIAYSVIDMLDGHHLINQYADSRDHVIPGHDPEILRRYPRLAAAGLDVACLHQAPAAAMSI